MVDDEPDLCVLISDALTDQAYEVTCANDGPDAMAAASAATFDVVLADMRLPNVDGLVLLRWLRAESPTPDLIVVTGNAEVGDAVAVLKEGAFDYLTTPVEVAELSVQLRRLDEFRSLQRDVAAIRIALPHRSRVESNWSVSRPACSTLSSAWIPSRTATQRWSSPARAGLERNW